MIFIHNHPSGGIKPSEEDLKTTDRLLKAGEIIEIDVIDHLIISEKTYFGFNQAGMIEELKNNGAYRIVERERADLEKWRLEQEKEKAGESQQYRNREKDACAEYFVSGRDPEVDRVDDPRDE